MTMAWIWTGMAVLSILCGLATGRGDLVAAAAVEGAKALKKPAWAQQEAFPFLKPQFNIVGMFLTDIPACDNLTQFRGYITMR